MTGKRWFPGQYLERRLEMGDTTKIQWCDHTFNPWVGCTKVSPGCANCYAEADMDKRRHFASWGPNGTRVMTSAANWKKPLKWNQDAEKAGVKRVVFCASLADVFEDWAGPLTNKDGTIIKFCATCGDFFLSGNDCGKCPKEISVTMDADFAHVRSKLFSLIDNTPNLIWRILTKRPENIRMMWPPDVRTIRPMDVPHRSNVHLYTSVENQAQADKRISHLFGWNVRDLVPVRGISAEPLLENFKTEWLAPDGINHVIVGGESGPDARPFCSGWAYDLRLVCQNTNVPLFVKQFGSNPFAGYEPDPNAKLQFADRKGGDWDEWLPVYRVRELPETYYSL
jgi:protein gp37